MSPSDLPAGYPFKPEFEVTPRAAAEGLARGEPLLDCRTPAEREAARIEGAVLIPLGELADRLDELGDHREGPIAVICHHGGRSLKATLLLRQAGFTGARSVAGGIDAWACLVDPGVGRYEQVAGRCVRLHG